jgi:hypothetical protein
MACVMVPAMTSGSGTPVGGTHVRALGPASVAPASISLDPESTGDPASPDPPLPASGAVGLDELLHATTSIDEIATAVQTDDTAFMFDLSSPCAHPIRDASALHE